MKRTVFAVVTREERESFILIRTKIDCAEQARREMPTLGDYTREEILLYVQGSINSLAEALFLERAWWLDTMEKYKVDPYTGFDVASGELYKTEKE